jgi:hypothetical protein
MIGAVKRFLVFVALSGQFRFHDTATRRFVAQG